MEAVEMVRPHYRAASQYYFNVRLDEGCRESSPREGL